jgi:hypothetical protein
MQPIISKGIQKPTIIKNTTNISTAIEIVYITITVTPTPDGLQFFSSEYDNGIRKIHRPFSFYTDNSSGYKSLKVSSYVYDYKIFQKLHWHNPSDSLDYTTLPTEGKKFIVVFYAMILDDKIGDDSSFYLPRSSTFVIADRLKDKTFSPYEYPKQLRILELENSYDYTDTIQAQYFGQHREYTSGISAKDTAGEISIEHDRIKPGLSNTESGYVIYEIDNDSQAENLITGINFYSFGSSWWKLK